VARRKEAAYVKRQLDFYHGCARFLKSQNQTWTTFQDNDEFVVATSAANASKEDIQRGQPGALLLKVFQQCSAKRDDPDIRQRYFASDHVAQFKEWDLWFPARPCVILIGAAPSHESGVRSGGTRAPPGRRETTWARALSICRDCRPASSTKNCRC
jgi:hypothetical protein